MNDNKIFFGIIITSVILLIGGVVFALSMGSAPQIESVLGAKAIVSSKSYEWGDIGINDGIVKTSFTISNEGSETLKLFNVSTSCMCTKARLKLDNKTSPAFGMHSKSSYVLDVPPQAKAEVLVEFDPAYHGPGGIGPITRQVMVETNDPDNSEFTFILTANVIR